LNRVPLQLRDLKGAIHSFDRYLVAIDSRFANHVECCPQRSERARSQFATSRVVQSDTIGVETFQRRLDNSANLSKAPGSPRTTARPTSRPMFAAACSWLVVVSAGDTLESADFPALS